MEQRKLSLQDPKPSGEYYLYTDMSKALDGLVRAVPAQVSFTGAYMNDDRPQWTLGGHDYLSGLAEGLMPRQNEIVVGQDSRADVAVSSVGGRDSLSVSRLAMRIGAGQTRDVVLHLHSESALLSLLDIDIVGGGRLNLVLLQDESDCQKIFTQTNISLGANARLNMSLVNLNPALVRNEVGIDVNGLGVDVKVGGAYSVSNGQHVDNVTVVRHHVGGSTSNQLFKGIADDGGMAAFSGLIVVDKGAQKTCANQTNRHLLAARGAHAYAKPQLEIYADDVKCSHGATTGQQDAAQLFYMQQRGISEEEARRLLAEAFLSEVYATIGVEDIRASLMHE